MKTILASALALGAMTSVAFAAEPAKAPDRQNKPVLLTDAQMDNVTAGQLVEVSRNDIAVQVPVSANIGACVIVEQCREVTGANPVNADARFPR